MNSEIMLLFSSGILGIFLGAQITEAVLFVPNWKALKADDFFEFYQNYGKKIYQFFAPINYSSGCDNSDYSGLLYYKSMKNKSINLTIKKE